MDEKYVVLSIADMQKYLSEQHIASVLGLANFIRSKRNEEGRRPKRFWVLSMDDVFAPAALEAFIDRAEAAYENPGQATVGLQQAIKAARDAREFAIFNGKHTLPD